MKPRVRVLVEGGKATPGPPLGPALGPLGVNIGQVVSKINEQTAAFEGMRVPVIVIVDKKTKRFEIEIGSPSVAVLVKKKLGLEKGAKTPGAEVVGNLTLAQAVEVARLKHGGTLARGLKAGVKEVLGTCLSMGISVEGRDAREVIEEVEKGTWDEFLK